MTTGASHTKVLEKSSQKTVSEACGFTPLMEERGFACHDEKPLDEQEPENTRSPVFQIYRAKKRPMTQSNQKLYSFKDKIPRLGYRILAEPEDSPR